jgi:hypothetical protein
VKDDGIDGTRGTHGRDDILKKSEGNRPYEDFELDGSIILTLKEEDSAI